MAYVKVGKSSVQYSKGMASSHCGICRFYIGIAGGDCQRVNKEGSPTPGRIDPSYWCKLFKKGSWRTSQLAGEWLNFLKAVRGKDKPQKWCIWLSPEQAKELASICASVLAQDEVKGKRRKKWRA